MASLWLIMETKYMCYTKIELCAQDDIDNIILGSVLNITRYIQREIEYRM